MFDTGNNQRTYPEAEAGLEPTLSPELIRLHFGIVEDDHTVILCHDGDKVAFFTIYTDRQTLRESCYEHLKENHHADYTALKSGVIK